MKIIAAVTIIGKDRKSFEPGSELDLPKPDAESLIERGLARLPEPEPAKGKKQDHDEGDDPDSGDNKDPVT
ncbi:hypothetical protein C8R26_13130 [Nitrosomonas oligotropha]|uniref:Uncharacterized protein n=1 Tax=Nitrosomonas oligotropha TaxID=42354 RepID=A0A2T5HGY6_9PROT|nr:hypothetical protein [Nitrosomonas oligotropha]PTQ70843.1 hypothetical protein C8R26_13130 [Nitrosomonas oligotropha]